jgi:hypothetical protein
MGVEYQVVLKNQVGTQVALFDDFNSLTFGHKVNDAGYFSLQLDGGDDRWPLFALDGQVEIYRSWKDWGLDWYLEFEGFCRTFVRQTFENGVRIASVYGQGYLDLLRRRIIAWPSGTAGAGKSGPVETVIKDYVNQNAGPGATVAAGRLANGVTAGLSIVPDAALGVAWEGSRAYTNLLATAQEIGDATGHYFDVIGIGAGLFEFRTYFGHRGQDRRVIGISPTGLNADGNAPIIFALEYGNMQEAVYSINRKAEANALFLLGRGDGENRTIETMEDALAIAESPWNRCESGRNASLETTTAGMQARGDAYLDEAGAKHDFVFKPKQTVANLYGKDYTWGDLMTAVYEEVTAQVEFLGVDISVGEGGEDISCTFKEIL